MPQNKKSKITTRKDQNAVFVYVAFLRKIWYIPIMTTITIPKKFMLNNDFVIIPRKQYESLLREKDGYIDEDLREALDDVKNGKVTGPFASLASGLRALKGAK